MPASSMPPPPAPPHRRSRFNSNTRFPPSPPYSPETPTCGLRKMSLSKGATFHVPSSPPAEDDPVISIRHLARRSPTCSHSSLMSLISDKRIVAARSIKDFEQTFSGARGKRQAYRRCESDEFDQQLTVYKRDSLPSDEGLGSSIDGGSDNRLAKSFERALDLVSDSALGTSIDSASASKENIGFELRRAFDEYSGVTTEDDGLSVQDLIQGGDHRVSVPPQSRQQGNSPPESACLVRRRAITLSISPQLANPLLRQQTLSNFARAKLAENILQPILREERFKFFHPLVVSLGSRHNKVIRCLRDLEQSLVFEPLVSNNLGLNLESKAYCFTFNSKTLAVSQRLFRTFGEFSIQLVVDTYQHLSEPEQRRTADRPYDNGYFLDLVQQVARLSAQIGSARQARTVREEKEPDTEEDNEMAYSPDDEVTLEGGYAATGRPAELVRWKNGKGISLRTNEVYESLPGIKRQHSNESLDDEVARSMARRKKNAEPETLEYPCSDTACGKIFNRKCDLQKHEKTHSRPFKCPERSCKYHEQGLPTEKERDRHINDKHAPNPTYFHCQFCPFKTKRESNCKQHMEKKHGDRYHYDRSKGNAKRTPRQTPLQTPQTPLMDYSPAIHATPESMYGGSSMSGSLAGTPYEKSLSTFSGSFAGPSRLYPNQQPDSYSNEDDLYTSPIENIVSANTGDSTLFHPTPAIDYTQSCSMTPATPYINNTPITPAAYSGASLGQSPYIDNMHVDIHYGSETAPVPYHTGLATPTSNFLQPHSRNPSISHESPLPQIETYATAQSNTYHVISTGSVMADDVMPNGDFPLFGGAADVGHFATPGEGMPVGDFAMFPDMDNYSYNYEADDVPSIDDFINIDHMSG